MVIEAAFLVLLAAVDAGPVDCATPKPLSSLVQRAQALRADAAASGASFTALVSRAQQLKDSAKAELPQLQAATCRNDAEMKRLEQCLAPLHWSCESVPPGVDWSFLAKVKRSEDEDLAYALGGAVLSGPANLFATCCGDFGCTADGVGMPRLLYDDDKVAKLGRLVRFDTPLGRAALETVRRSASALARANCSCDHPSAEDVNDVVGGLSSAAKAAQGDASKELQQLSAALAKGLPKTRCKLPGY